MIAIGAAASNFVVRKFLGVDGGGVHASAADAAGLHRSADLLEASAIEALRQTVSVALLDGLRAVGFVKHDDLSFLAMPGDVAVYLAVLIQDGRLAVVVARDRVQPLAIDSASLMAALVVPGGVSRVAKASSAAPGMECGGFAAAFFRDHATESFLRVMVGKSRPG